MKFEIKNRWNGKVIFSLETESLKLCIEAAIKSEANLREADLRGADLYGADLREAYLRGVDIDGETVKLTPLTVSNLIYHCLITDNYMRLGCKRFTHTEWENFNDEQILKMDDDALPFWKTWKEPLLAMCAAHRSNL